MFSMRQIKKKLFTPTVKQLAVSIRDLTLMGDDRIRSLPCPYQPHLQLLVDPTGHFPPTNRGHSRPSHLSRTPIWELKSGVLNRRNL